MKRILATGVAAASMLPALAHPACNANVAADWPNGRFTVNGELVTDKATGLVWKRCPEGLSGQNCANGAALTLSWQDALKRPGIVNASPATLGLGHNDWRLPNRNELASLVERQCFTPAVNPNAFPATPSQSFWSSSTYSLNGTMAWFVGFDVGNVAPLPKVNLMNVRLVRSGP